MYSLLSRVSHNTAIIGLLRFPYSKEYRKTLHLSQAKLGTNYLRSRRLHAHHQRRLLSSSTYFFRNAIALQFHPSGSLLETLQWVASSSGEEVDMTYGGRTISSGSLLPSSTRSAMLPTIHRCIPLRAHALSEFLLKFMNLLPSSATCISASIG